MNHTKKTELKVKAAIEYPRRSGGNGGMIDASNIVKRKSPHSRIIIIMKTIPKNVSDIASNAWIPSLEGCEDGTEKTTAVTTRTKLHQVRGLSGVTEGERF